MPDTRQTLIGKTWTRDRSRGGPGREGVYVTSAFEAVPGRGGFETLTFRADGAFTMIGPGPSNRTETQVGIWRVDEAMPGKVVLEFAGGARGSMEVKGASEISFRIDSE